jgi:acyl transferase domain-containing protein
MHAGTATPLRLTAAKARMGHAEPAAGAVGIAHAAGMLTQRRRAALTHLRALNPLVLSGARSGARLALPRQGAAAAACASAEAEWDAVQCVSSFAFQGTNAHAVLCTSAAAKSGAGGMHAAAPTSWRRQRHWYLGPMHQLLMTAGVAGRAGPEATFHTPLARAHLGTLLKPACL